MLAMLAMFIVPDHSPEKRAIHGHTLLEHMHNIRMPYAYHMPPSFGPLLKGKGNPHPESVAVDGAAALVLQNREIHGSPLAETSLIRNTLPATAGKSPSKSLLA